MWEVESEVCQVVVDNLPVNREYRAQVCAQNVMGWGLVSKWTETARTAPSAVSRPIAPVKTHSTCQSITVVVTQPHSNPLPIQYEVWCGSQDEVIGRPPDSPRGGSRKQSKTLDVRIGDLRPRIPYRFRVRARNVAGWSEWSGVSPPFFCSDNWSFEEIQNWLIKRYGNVNAAFRVFDRKGEGEITEDQFIAGFEEVGLEDVPLEQRLRVFMGAEAGKPGGDKVLVYKDFARIFSSHKATPGVTYGVGLNPVSEVELQRRVEVRQRRSTTSVGSGDESPNARPGELQMRVSVTPQFIDGQLTRIGGAGSITTTRDRSASTSLLKAMRHWASMHRLQLLSSSNFPTPSYNSAESFAGFTGR